VEKPGTAPEPDGALRDAQRLGGAREVRHSRAYRESVTPAD